MSRPGAGIAGLLACVVLASVSPAIAQVSPERAGPSPEPIPVSRLSGPITLDGVVDDLAWDDIDPVPLIQFAPIWGAEPTERSEIRIGYDDQYLYMSGRLYDSDPNGIRLNTYYRDQFSGDDLLSILIDSYNDYETAYWFVTNPGGTRTDRAVSNDGESTGRFEPGARGFTGGGAMNSDWNSHWDVATTITEQGWFAEFRIPFSTIGFQPQGDEVTMGISIYRYIGRKAERSLFPAIGQEYGGFAFGKPSQTQRMTLQGVVPSNPVYVTPYGLGGFSQIPELREPPDVPTAGWETVTDPTTEIGADLKYSPTSNVALDLTVNTDFAQVEADDQQINLTRFPLFFPEKRQFFQERASTFDFQTGGTSDRLFFSRRIGLSDDGELVRIYGGGRMVGRFGGMDVGFLNMQTAPEGDASGENMGVLRLNQKVFNPYSTIGGIVTTRLGNNGQNNVAYGLDADVRVFGDEYMTLQWAQTFDEEIEEADALEAGLIRARWERQTEEGLSYFGEYSRVGDSYLPRLGFQTRDDFSFYSGRLQYQKFTSARSPLQTVTVSGTTGNYYRNSDNTAESRLIEPELSFEWKNGAELSFTGSSHFESIRDTFDIADIAILPDDYWFHAGAVRFQMSRAGLFRGGVNATVGSFYDGTRVGMGLNPTWNPSRYFEFGGGYNINWLTFSDRDESETTHLGQLRVDFALNTNLSLSTFLQYNSTVDQTSINARFRYNFREGTDLWIVYNEGYNHERENGFDPRAPLSAGRSLLVKYTHTFIW